MRNKHSTPLPVLILGLVLLAIVGYIAVVELSIPLAFLGSLVIAFLASKVHKAAPLYLAILAIPALIGLSYIAKNGNAWDKLIQQVTAYVMLMIIFGGYSLIYYRFAKPIDKRPRHIHDELLEHSKPITPIPNTRAQPTSQQSKKISTNHSTIVYSNDAYDSLKPLHNKPKSRTPKVTAVKKNTRRTNTARRPARSTSHHVDLSKAKPITSRSTKKVAPKTVRKKVSG